jgi:hypothetical protein
VITAEQIAQLDESDIRALQEAPGLTGADHSLLSNALALKHPVPGDLARPPEAITSSIARQAEPSTALPLRPEQQAHIDRELQTTAKPLDETKPTIGGAVADSAGGLPAAAAGIAGGFYQGVPGLAPTLEAIGQRSDQLTAGGGPISRMIRRLPNVVPRPGEINQAVEESPQGPIASRTIGGLIAPLGAAGKLGESAEAAGSALLAPVTNIYRNLAGKAPGLMRTVGAGAGTGAAIGAGEATIRRLPGAAANLSRAVGATDEPAQEIPPVDIAGEIGAPALLGGALYGATAGLPAWATDPNTVTGRIANRFANVRNRGLHMEEPLRSLPEGQIGIDEARELANREFEDRKPGLEAPVLAGERQAKAALERDLTEAKGSADEAKGRYGAEAEQQAQKLLQVGRAEGAKRLVKVLDKHEQAQTQVSPDARFPIRDEQGNPIADENGNPVTQSFYEKIRGIVAKKARQDTANSQAPGRIENTGYQDDYGRPIERELPPGEPGTGEVHTPLGAHLANIEKGIRGFIKDDGSVRDWRNILAYLKTMAESGTPEKSFPYKKFVGAVREHLGDAVPEIAQANAEYSERMDGLERVKDAVYGNPDLHDLGTSAAPGPLDVPEAGEPLVHRRMLPSQEARGAQRLAQLGDQTLAAGARSPQRQEMLDQGLGQVIEPLEQKLADVRNATYETQAKHDEAVAKVEAEVARKKLEIARELGSETDQVLLNKEAIEASQPRLKRLLHPLTLAAVAATTHSPAHAASLGAYSGERLGGGLAQPLASQLALRAPDVAALQASIPGLMGMVAAKNNAEELIQQARDAKKRVPEKKKPKEEVNP